MKKENIDFLEANKDCYSEAVNAQTVTRFASALPELHRIIKEEFYPGFAWHSGCGSCGVSLITILYNKYFEWVASQPTEPLNHIHATFPAHTKTKNHHRK